MVNYLGLVNLDYRINCNGLVLSLDGYNDDDFIRLSIFFFFYYFLY